MVLGSTTNGYSPFNIAYEYGVESNVAEDGHEYHTAEILSCKDTAPGYDAGCGCSQCPAACNITKPDFSRDESVGDWEVAGMNGLGFVMIFVFIGVSGLILLLSCCCSSVSFTLFSNCRLNININAVIEKFFEKWGRIVARRPVIVLIISVVIALGLSAGAIKLKVTTDPIELWAAPTSRSRVEKDFFDSEFRPFYRTALVIIKAVENPDVGMNKIENNGYIFSSMFNKQFLRDTLDLQKKIEAITFEYEEVDDDGNTRTEVYDLSKVCNKPLNPFNSNCNINSIWAYWNDTSEHLDVEHDMSQDPGSTLNVTLNYLDHFLECTKNPSMTKQQDAHTDQIVGCQPRWGGVVNPYYVLGGFIPEGEAFPERPKYERSEAIILQIIIDNYDMKSEAEVDVKGLERAMAWEEQFVKFMKDWVKNEMPSEYMDVAFTSERSVEDELDRETYGDVATIAVSYIIMFVYITLALGQYSSFSITGLLIESKITLGLFGVMIVILSVFASMGVFSLIGVPATLIIFEIIPFLVLAVGVDNIFILVQTYQRDKRGKTETVEVKY